MAEFKLLPDIWVPTFEMKVDNVMLPLPIARTILEISVTEHLNPPSEFSFRLNDPKLEFINKKTGLFTEGKLVEISIGYVGNIRNMIVGEISVLEANFPNSGPATLQIQGFDLLHRLTRGSAYRTFGDSEPDSGDSDSQIVESIASELNLKPSIDTTPARTKPRVQKYKTNLSFLEELAIANGYTLWVEGDTLNFKKQSPNSNTIQLEWKKTLMSFSPRLSTARQVKEVVVRGWDPIQKSSLIGKASPESEKSEFSKTGKKQVELGANKQSQLVIDNAPVTSNQEAQSLADMFFQQQKEGIITGNGTAVGQPEMSVGTILELKGIGRFNGRYLVKKVTHSVGDNGYHSSFEVIRQTGNE